MLKKRVFIGLIRDHRTRVGRIKAIDKKGSIYGSEGKTKDQK